MLKTWTLEAHCVKVSHMWARKIGKFNFSFYTQYIISQSVLYDVFVWTKMHFFLIYINVKLINVNLQILYYLFNYFFAYITEPPLPIGDSYKVCLLRLWTFDDHNEIEILKKGSTNDILKWFTLKNIYKDNNIYGHYIT